MEREKEAIISELNAFSADQNWLSQNIDNLRKDFENRYVLVQNKQVVLVNRNYDELLDEAEQKKIKISTAVIEKILPIGVTVLL